MKVAVWLSPLLVLWALPARGQSAFPPISDRDYVIDLYQGTAVGALRTVGMGGTVTAIGEGAEGMILQPAAVASRPRSALEKWDWDGTVNGSVPSLGSDVDNNGNPSPSHTSIRSSNASLLGLLGPYGLGLSYYGTSYRIRPDAGPALEFQASVARIALGRTFADGLVVPALALRFGGFSVARAQGETLFSATGANIEAGVLVNLPDRPTRYGVRWSLPVKASHIESRCTDAYACAGFILPSAAKAPWEIAFGAAWRFGASQWNQHDSRRFIDERALVIAADLVVAGSVDRATGIESFTNRVLQPSGEGWSFSPRLGAEVELLPGSLRVRGGTYYEPARFKSASSRLHATLGAEFRIVSFQLYGNERRLACSFALDLARKYGNIGVSLGFWH